jgi:hypothetical protein
MPSMTPINASPKALADLTAAIRALAVVKARALVTITQAELDLRKAELAIAREEQAA